MGPRPHPHALHLVVAGVIRHALLMHGLHWLQEGTMTRQAQQGGTGRGSMQSAAQEFTATENVHPRLPRYVLNHHCDQAA